LVIGRLQVPILEHNDDVRKVIAIDLMNNNSETVILDKGPRTPDRGRPGGSPGASRPGQWS
jgi:hypothetical protein